MTESNVQLCRQPTDGASKRIVEELKELGVVKRLLLELSINPIRQDFSGLQMNLFRR